MKEIESYRSWALVVCVLLSFQSAFAADIYWTNNANPATFNIANNWTNGGIPTATDNAIFANNAVQTIQWNADATNANAYFNSTQFKTLLAGTQTYLVTNSFVLAQNSGQSGFLLHSNGTVAVVNDAGTASLIVGLAGATAQYFLRGGTVTADQLMVTNTGSLMTLEYGTLNTLHGSTIVTPGANSYSIGTIANQTMTWNIGGGTNLLKTSGAAGTQIGIGGTGIVNVFGPGTVWSNTADLRVGRTTSGQLTITNSASAYNVNGIVGDFAIGTALVGTNSLWNNSGTLTVGNSAGASGSQLTITNGGVVRVSGASTIGNGGGNNNNTVLVTGAGSLWSNATTLAVGSNGSTNQLKVANGGKVYVTTTLTVGAGSVGAANEMVVTNGGQVVNLGNGTVGSSGGSALGNKATVVGSGSVWSNSALLYVGNLSSLGQLNILDGGTVTVGTDLHIGEGNATSSAFSSNNTVMVSGTGALLKVAGAIYDGFIGDNNQLIVTNGGSVIVTNASVNGNVRVGQGVGHTNSVLITGNGSYLLANKFFVGTNGTTLGIGSALITQGGTLEANQMEDGYNGSGTISNRGGIFQFTLAAPSISVHTAGSIVLTNGTVSFRDLTTAATTPVSGINYFDDNTFRLNHSTNVAGLGSYTFNSVANTGNASNYQALALINGASWRSSTLTIGSGGSVLVSNSTSRVDATFVSTGTVKVVNSMMTFASNVVINGKYISDPSTNIFMADVTVSQSGTLAGGLGDRFEFNKSSLFIHSTNNTGFNLALSSVAFTGGGMHTNAITGADLGSNITAFSAAYEVQNNFAYGELHLGSVTDQVCFTCGVIPAPGVTNNALYVGWLDLFNNPSLVTNLHAASGINIYYNVTDPRNAYLANTVYPLTDCNFASGGGFLMPIIPEPSTLVFLSAAVGLLAFRRRKSDNR